MKIDFIKEDEYPQVYELLRKVREFPENEDSVSAEICLYWKYEIKEDQDGIIELGKMQICNEANRKLHNVDAILYLNHETWQDLTDHQREALLFHEVHHLAISLDKHGDVKRTDDDRICYRNRAHPIEEFPAVTKRYGAYKDIYVLFKETLT